MAELTKRCEICNKTFKPDRRVGDRQRVCSSLSCQQERKRRSYKAWLHQNPDAFKGRYDNTKDWLQAHPGYLRIWRQKRRAAVRRDIQNELTCLESIPPSELSDIQNKLTSCFQRHLPYDDGSFEADIQNELRLFISMLYLAMIYKSRLVL